MKSYNGNEIEEYDKVKPIQFENAYCKNCGKVFDLYILPHGIDINRKPYVNVCVHCTENKDPAGDPNQYKIRSGYRVIGNNPSDGHVNTWYAPNFEHASSFAQNLAESIGKEVDICKYVGSIKPKYSSEFIIAKDVTKEELNKGEKNEHS